jgi:hypothetical protein
MDSTTGEMIEQQLDKISERGCPLKEMGQMILTIYLSTMDLTTNLIKDALETISGEFRCLS